MINRKWIRITAIVIVAAMLLSTIVAGIGLLFY
jgi:preprotein translocase subunit SecE